MTLDPEALYVAVAEMHNAGELDALSVLLDPGLGSGQMAD